MTASKKKQVKPSLPKPVKAWALVDSNGNHRKVSGVVKLYEDSWQASDNAERLARTEGDVIYHVMLVQITVLSK